MELARHADAESFLAAAGGWNEGLYRTWYLAGAFGGAAYLGLGTIFLLIVDLAWGKLLAWKPIGVLRMETTTQQETEEELKY